jgi:hypothetical protein
LGISKLSGYTDYAMGIRVRIPGHAQFLQAELGQDIPEVYTGQLYVLRHDDRVIYFLCVFLLI